MRRADLTQQRTSLTSTDKIVQIHPNRQFLAGKMDSSPAKRRKLEHQSPHQDKTPLHGAAASAGTSQPSAFVLQTKELLGEVRLNYDKAFAGADALLHQIKAAIEAIEPRDPTPVSCHVRTPKP